MFCTVTCNPSLDYTLSLPSLCVGQVNRAAAAALTPGGKGVNVARMARRLGLPVRAAGFAGGFTGDALARALAEEGVETAFLAPGTGCTRINVKLLDGRTATELNAPGPAAAESAWEALESSLAGLGAGDVLVLSGSVPPGAGQGVYGRLAAGPAARGALVAVDAEGPLLLQALAARPFLVKPNREELAALFGQPVDTFARARAGAARLQAAGARHVLVSMGADGAVLLAEDGTCYAAAAPSGAVRSAVGAGDAMVAGFLAGWLAGGAPAPALCWGIAAGSAWAFAGGPPSGETVHRFLGQIAAKPLATGGEIE